MMLRALTVMFQIGPIVSNFVAAQAGWRWVMWTMTLFAGTFWIVGSLVIPETYAPVILRRRGQKLTKLTGKLHVSIYESKSGHTATTMQKIRKVLFRPWMLLIYEPIVLLISVYMAILYATLFMLLGAFPIVFAETRGWAQGVSGLPFIGICVGMISGALHTIYDNKRYLKVIEKPENLTPEARLPPGLLGAVITPVSKDSVVSPLTSFPEVN